MRGKRCPQCNRVSFSARSRPPWPCPYCGAEIFFVPDEPDPPEKEKRNVLLKATEGLAVDLAKEVK